MLCFYWVCVCFFFFKQKTAYEMRISDWSSDVCSSDLKLQEAGNLDAALAKINEAAAKAETPDEKFVIGQFNYNIAAAKKDDALLEKATRAMLESGSAPEDMKKPLVRNLAAFSLQRQDYAGALTQFKAQAGAAPDDAKLLLTLFEH